MKWLLPDDWVDIVALGLGILAPVVWWVWRRLAHPPTRPNPRNLPATYHPMTGQYFEDAARELLTRLGPVEAVESVLRLEAGATDDHAANPTDLTVRLVHFWRFVLRELLRANADADTISTGAR